MINNRLTSLERILTPAPQQPSVIYTDGVESEQQAVDRYNQHHGTNHPLEVFNLIAIAFIDNPPLED